MTGYERQVSPGGAQTGVVQASPEAFGAGIGDAIADAGRLLERNQVHAETAAAGLRAADARLAITKGVADLQQTMGVADPGYHQAVSDLVDSHRDAVLGGIANRRVGEELGAQWTEYADRQKGEAYVTGLAGQQAKAVSDIGQQAQTGGARSALAPADNGAFGDEIMAIDHSIDTMTAPPELRERARREAYQTIGLNRFAAWTQSDPKAAKTALETGGYNLYVGGHLPELIRSADVAIARQDAQARAVVNQATAEEKQAIATERATLEQGRGTPEQWQALAARAQAVGDGDAAVRDRGQASEIAATEHARDWSPVERQERIDTLAAKPQLSASEGAELKGLKGQQAYLDKQPVLARFTYATGKAVAPIDWSDPSSIASRAATVSAAQRRFGGKPDFLLPGEETPIRDLIHSPDRASRIEAAHAVLAAGPYAGKVLDQVAGDSQEFRSAVSLAALPRGGALMDMALRGPEALRASPGMLNPYVDPATKGSGAPPPPTFDQIYNAQMASATALLPPEYRRALYDNTRNLYAAFGGQGGWTFLHPGGVDRAKRFALGGVETGAGWAGGLGSWQGQPLVLPRGMTQAEFDGRVARAGGAQWIAAADDPRDAPWAGDRPLHAAELRALVPTMVRDGVYALRQDGHYITTKSGRQFTFDVRKLPATP